MKWTTCLNEMLADYYLPICDCKGQYRVIQIGIFQFEIFSIHLKLIEN